MVQFRENPINKVLVAGQMRTSQLIDIYHCHRNPEHQACPKTRIFLKNKSAFIL